VAEVTVLTPLPQPGELVDRYSVVTPIAQGGMAAVYAVRRKGLEGFDKLLAMKVLLPHLAAERRFVDMFLDEARVAARLQHANLAQVFDSGLHRGLPYLVMEFLHGKSLAQCQLRAAECGRRLSEPFILSVLGAAATGLHAAHETRGDTGQWLGIVHRDVSPQNLHVGYDGQVKVVDFGISLAAGRLSITRTGEVKGKLCYVAPEQLDERAPIDRRADVWALGVVAWEAFAGQRLFARDSDSRTLFSVLSEPVPSLAERAPTLAPSLVELITRCLSRDPSGRPPTAEAVAQVLLASAPAVPGPSIAQETEALFGLDRANELAQLGPSPRSVRGLATPAASQEGVPGPGSAASGRRTAISFALASLIAALGFALWGQREPASAPVAPVASPPAAAATPAPPLAPPAGSTTEAEADAEGEAPRSVRRPARRAKTKSSAAPPSSETPASSPLLKNPYPSREPR
jgi:eukaryotic-like serine/threonine-protein kinase